MSGAVQQKYYAYINGQKKPVIKKNGFYYYEYLGRSYKIDDMNSVFTEKEHTSTANELAQKSHKYYEYCVGKIKESKQYGKFLLQKYSSAKKTLSSYLEKLGVSNINDISNSSERTQALAYSSDITQTKFAQIRNSSDVIFYAHQGTSAAISEGRFNAMT